LISLIFNRCNVTLDLASTDEFTVLHHSLLLRLITIDFRDETVSANSNRDTAVELNKKTPIFF